MWLWWSRSVYRVALTSFGSGWRLGCSFASKARCYYTGSSIWGVGSATGARRYEMEQLPAAKRRRVNSVADMWGGIEIQRSRLSVQERNASM